MSAEEAKKEATKKVEASAKKSAVAKTKKSAGAKKGPKVEVKKLTYLEMVTEAIKALKDRTGSSRQVALCCSSGLYFMYFCSGDSALYHRDV